MPKIDAYPKMSKKGEGPRSVEFDPPAGLGGAKCLGEMGETGVG